jgi:aryl-alcohol dehydrogenase-like predicted oxidoreductase
MISRRQWLTRTLGAGASLTLAPRLLEALEAGLADGILPQGTLIERAIPSTGERIPVIGLGSSATFSSVARSEDQSALREVLKVMTDRGAKVFDTAPCFGASVEVAGEIAYELGITNKLFWATKVNVARGGSADPVAMKAQLDASFARYKQPKIDCIQVHNLGDIPTQLAALKELKKEGRVRYIGTTSTSDGQYGRLEEVMRNEPLDFIGVDYAADNRNVEEKILPLAIERKIGVLVYLPFGRTSLFQRVAGKDLPEWAKEFDANSWAQFFLKYVVSHPAVTAVTPATSKAVHMIDNIGGGIGKLPNDAMRKRMASFVDSLPPAPGRGGRGGE